MPYFSKTYQLNIIKSRANKPTSKSVKERALVYTPQTGFNMVFSFGVASGLIIWT